MGTDVEKYIFGLSFSSFPRKEEKGRINGSFRGKSISRMSFIGREKRLGIESGRDEDNDERTRNDLSTIFLLFEFRPGDVANVLRDET